MLVKSNVVEYEDKPTERVDYYNAFGVQFGFRKEIFLNV